MGIWENIKQRFQRDEGGQDVAELARHLGMEPADLQGVRPQYQRFKIPKRSGGVREIAAPEPALKALQRRILRRVLGRLKCHPCAVGFERQHSIVTNARPHVGRAVVLRMDIRDFFPSTTERRIAEYLRHVGWNREATKLLTTLCTDHGGLPQGAPTSPRLANLVNYGLDARLAGLAAKTGARYTRYADDLTFSFAKDDSRAVHRVIRATERLLRDFGYRLHLRRKLQIRRQHQRQLITGLVVNEGIRLPRTTRRRLRAIEHHLRTGRPTSITAAQQAGWASFQAMVAKQSAEA
jgi:retron-type reverse transcriptase